MDWHPAKVSLRGNKYYVVMTVPREARAAMGGEKQVRRSARTTDRYIAEKRRYELEGVLREQVKAAVRKEQLQNSESHYHKAVRELRLTGVGYDFPYDLEFGDVVPRHMEHAPENTQQAELAANELQKLLHALRGLDVAADNTSAFLELFDHFQGPPPSTDAAQMLVDAAVAELGAAFATEGSPTTMSAYLDVYELKLDQRVARKDLKGKTAKARIKNIRQFIKVVGNSPLKSLKASEAYAFAQHLEAEGFGNSTIKTRVSDVTTLLDAAVKDGELSQNPFVNLKLSRIGMPGQNQTPLTDDLLGKLFSIPKLPEKIRGIWAVLICTGMRLDEAALCKANQVKGQDGVLYFDLQNAAVKNRQSQRRVPICETLEPLVLKLLSDSGECDRLFDFPIKADGKTRASEQCGYWMKKIDLNKLSGDKSAWYTNHSLRGTFKDKMRDAEVGLEVHNAIMGHDTGGVAASYGRGPSLAVMKAAVDKAQHPYLEWIEEAVAAIR